jgi:hypothetical protein
MDQRPFALAYAASLVVAGACSATSTAPDHGGTDASMDAAPSPDGSVDVEVETPTCQKGADCMSGQVCCLYPAATGTTGCQAGPCPDAPSFGMPVQLCASAAECLVAGDICGAFPVDTPAFPFRVCQPLPVLDGGACWESGGKCYLASVTCTDFVSADCPSGGICCLEAPITNPDGGDASPADASAADAGLE